MSVVDLIAALIVTMLVCILAGLLWYTILWRRP